MSHFFGLIDCNNFYATCERVFNPRLLKKPIVILSNNDGCIIARSNEVKALGVPMGMPVHEYKDILARNGVYSFSANFELYGDISKRVMDTIKNHCHDVEIYSIDEAFMSFDSMHISDYEKYARDLRQKIVKYTSITTSIGVAKTKTLSKIANKIAKKNDGVLCFLDEETTDKYLKNLDVSDIWGIGFNLTNLLRKNGIYNAYDFKHTDDRWAKENISVIGQKMVFELRGIPCFKMEDNHAPKKGILSSRSFGKYVVSLNELKESVAVFTSRAAQKLRHQKSLASFITVSIRTGKHSKIHYHKFATVPLTTPTFYTPDLVKHAFIALEKCFDPQFAYKKASVMLTGLVPESCMKINMFEQEYSVEKYKKVMGAFDKLNFKLGSNTIKVASTGTTMPWKGKRESVTPRYTTHWDELLKI